MADMMQDPRSGTKTQRENFRHMASAVERIYWDLYSADGRAELIPEEWHEISEGERFSAKERVTLRVEKDVLKFFRSIGPGYQTRMNDVLKAFMHARLSGLLRTPDQLDPLKFEMSEGMSELAAAREERVARKLAEMRGEEE
ncbi:BrnA antitoxin of type II toxin-antitoxin system [Poseidonocella pacifica]|uniref:BrnA antitoxin of type II toxin-antitoxin system n=1 Tax=Poseidonocella pacifica TaxID=871651 RepID=A0A1I0V3P0_9RHOB|nr:BrnA antitoxin family protein [Poseidonocella pacifica]SFA70945.1 BrnA antitoxin of type II toxin-antitoxin system [Poseidonocella pacifica]